MSQNDEAGVEREQISLSAVYRQLDDHLGPDEAPYDVGAGLERLVSWMSEEPPASQVVSSVEYLEHERLVRDRELVQYRTKAIEWIGARRLRSSLIATSTVALLSLLAGLALLFGLPLVPVHAAIATVVTIGIIDALMAFAVGYIHRTTMKSLQGDMELSFGTGAAPRQERSHAGEEGSHGGGNSTEPSPPPQGSMQRIDEVVPGKSRLALQSILVGIVAASAAATYWLGRTADNWIPLTVAIGTALFLLFMLLIAVIMPAIWSRSSQRRDSAKRVLYAMLGLTMRTHTHAVGPELPSHSRLAEQPQDASTDAQPPS
jgi:hypothetical protein